MFGIARRPLPASRMAQLDTTAIKKTALHARHVSLGARMVPFAGWEMPVEYSGIADEHLAVRTRGGAAHHEQRRREAQDRAGALRRPHVAERRIRGRSAGVPVRRRSLPAR